MANPNTAAQTGLKVPNNETRIVVSQADLPVHCPMEGSSLWNSHPRVFIPVETTGSAKCPYCGTEYVLEKA